MTKNDFYIEIQLSKLKNIIWSVLISKSRQLYQQKAANYTNENQPSVPTKIIIVLKIKKICVFLQRENND